MKILANDGISKAGKEKLEAAGFIVETTHVEQEQLINAINQENYIGLCVRSATKVRKELIDACTKLKFIGRGGVGMDNIDVEYARNKGIIVNNTPAASSQSVAELAMASLFSLARSTYDSYKEMPKNGHIAFKQLKKKYGKGIELRGKTLVIIGLGRIGQSLAGYALGCGMKVIGVTRTAKSLEIPFEIQGIGKIVATLQTQTVLEEVLPIADFITLNVPQQADGGALIRSSEFELMKDGVRIVNVARGGIIDEDALLDAIQNGKVAAAALDVYLNEPTPREDLIKHKAIASTPHIGAATMEAQDRIGIELANKIIDALK